MGNLRKRKAGTANKQGSGGSDKTTTSSGKDDGKKSNTMKEKQKQFQRRSQSSINMMQKNKQLIFGSIILIVAFFASLFWNDYVADPIDTHVQALVQKGCSPSRTTARSKGIAYCSNTITPTRRTFQTLKPLIKNGETLFEIPRSIQIWDIDAIRFLNNHEQYNDLLVARHKHTNNTLATGAFLATYLSLLLSDSGVNENINNKNSKLREAYLNALPTIEELQQNHPIFWYEETLIERLNGSSSRQTLSYVLIKTYRDMILSEYNAFQHASVSAATQHAPQEEKRFDQLVNLTLYTASRINVMTRSFNPGSCYSHLLNEEKEDGRDDEQLHSLHDEIEYYRTQIGQSDYLREDNGGCHAMVPFLDLLNHHPNPNVNYRYDKSKQSFIIQSLMPSRASTIPPNHELYDSYGKHTESHLFAKYGFINGDGSSITQVSLALYHRVLNILNDGGEFSYLPFIIDDDASTAIGSNKMQSKGLRKYLRHDDGYTECVKPSIDGQDYHLKKLKFQHLQFIANDPSRWSVHMGSPRNPNARPQPSSTTSSSLSSHPLESMLNPPEFDPSTIRVDLSKVLATCRLISLTIHDFNGQAIQMLEGNVSNPDFILNVEEQYQTDDSSDNGYYSKESLDYRSFTCLARLAGSSLMMYKTKINDQYKYVKDLNTKRWNTSSANPDEQNVNSIDDIIKWTIGHVRLGEMQTLQAIMNIAFSNIHQMDEKYKMKGTTASGVRPPEFTVRDSVCPSGFSDSLMPPLAQPR